MNYKTFGTLLLMGLVLNSVLAQPTLTQVKKTAAVAVTNAKATLISAKSTYQDAKQGFTQAVRAYKTTKNAANLRVAKERAVTFLNNGADTGLRQLEGAKAKIEEIEGMSDERKETIIAEIEAKITGLTNIKENLADGNASPQDIVSAARTIKNNWDDTRLALKKIAGHTLLAKVNNLIRKAEHLYDLINDRAQVLEAHGKDISAITTWLDEFGEDIETAKERVEEAKEQFAQITTLAQADRFFRAANQKIERVYHYVRRSYVRLVRIAKELRKAKYAVNVMGHGWIHAYGNGTAELMGNGTILAKTSVEGSVLVSGDNPIITARGNGTRTEIDNGSTLFEGYGGIKIRGLNLDVEIEGTDIHLVAYGRGSATLTGEGTFKSGKTGGEWLDWSASGVTTEVSDE